jgi:hypothetical protein
MILGPAMDWQPIGGFGKPPCQPWGPGALPLPELPGECRIYWGGLLLQGGNGDIPAAGGRSWRARGLFHSPVQYSSCVYDFCEIWITPSQPQVWGVTSKVRKLWKEFFPHESRFPKM